MTTSVRTARHALGALVLGLCLAPTAHATVTFTAPTPYLQSSDNPLAGPFAWQHLETAEDGAINTPGLSVNAGVASGGSVWTDSVDADDGAVDGWGASGKSWYSNANNYLTFSFDAGALGGLPTQVGLVFTDIGTPYLSGWAEMKVYDGVGTLVGSGGFLHSFDGSALSNVGDDRFLGAVFGGGIGAITVGFSNSSDWEVDHVFYALAPVPENGTLLLMAAGVVALAGRARRRVR
jgi:hypothetical protein